MPALALAEALRAARPGVEPVLVGARRGVEARILPNRPFRHHLLPVEPLERRAWWKNLRWLVLWWQVRAQCQKILEAERPVLAVGTGGYVAGPMLLSALGRGIPIALQEQNAYPGLTTRWLVPRARQLHLGFPEARKFLHVREDVEVHSYGNPISPPPNPLPPRTEARQRLGLRTDLPAVFVTGGSQGAHAINQVVEAMVEAGTLDHVGLLWSTGLSMWQRYARFNGPPKRLVRPFWDPVEEAYAAVDLVVARAGAMSTAEFCAWGLPSLLIPLPSAAGGHQQHNAQALAAAGAALYLDQSSLTPARMSQEIQGLLGQPERLEAMGQAARARGRPEAARAIAERLLALVS